MKSGNVVWLWGMSGSGKTSLGFKLAQEIGYVFLDSDSVRRILNVPPDFSMSGRLTYQEALRHHVSGLQQRGINIVVASITPLQKMRDLNRELFDNYYEVYLQCDISVLIKRDPKGFYQRAFHGDISEFTGITSPFELPTYENTSCVPDITLNTGDLDFDSSYSILLRAVKNRFVENQ